ncbi:MAG: single-stranded-DNA-specific exonuclease RecJ [Candidatus Paceibacterota bacterium]|jgi:single-stranded-DNA-specific exonuclease
MLVREEIPEKVAKELGKFPEILRKLLYYRGIKTEKDAESFINPIFEDNNDPFKIYGMDIAVERIFKAIEKKEKIVIYSDYDADGIPGAVVLHDFLQKIGHDNFENYIPHRVLEGFGLNDEAIDEFAKKKVDLIITVDCGIADVEEADKIKKHKIDLIITDHHEPRIDAKAREELPEAIAILDNKQKKSEYPDKNLCGAGVVFKLVQALIKKYRKKWDIKDGWEKWLLDMVSIATISDMVPLVGENRLLAYFGLKVLRKSPRPGLQKLLSIIKVDQKNITEDDIGFMISPRINAASRMGIPEDAFNLLVTKNDDEAFKYATHLNKINDERKGIVAVMVKEIRKHWNEFDPEKKRKVLVAGNPDWKPSLLGLVANSLMDEHNGPVFLWGREEGKTLKGSCRSDGCVDIVVMMRESAHLFDEYGGHAASGGFSVSLENVDLLADGLEASYQKVSISGSDKEELIADAVITIDDVNKNLEKEISLLAPFGMGNPKPIFLLKNIEIHEIKIFGKKNDHLKIDFVNNPDVSVGAPTKASEKRRIVSAIAFFKKPGDFSVKIEKGERINLFANIEKSFFLGREEIRLRIVDIE